MKSQLLLKSRKLIDKNNLIVWVVLLLTGAVSIYYDMFFDLVVLFSFLLASYSIGLFFKMNTSYISSVLIRIAIGMGVLGFLTYYALLIGIGSASLYILMILIPITLQHRKLRKSFEEGREQYRNTKSKIPCGVTFLAVFIYFVLGDTAANWADAIGKYLSVVLYAAEHGVWKTNVIESIIYADQFSMYCSLATFGVALGAEKFCIWISTLSCCLTLIFIIELAKVIYQKTSIILIIAVYCTVPFFYFLGTDMSIDFAQVVFIMGAILCMADFDKDRIWDNLYPICFLCSSAIFAKLTSAYIVLVLGCVVIFYLFKYAHAYNIRPGRIVMRFAAAAIFLAGGLIIPIAYGFYYMGNPVFPWLNGIFNSPYAASGNYVDPYQASTFGFNLDTLLKIVFRTRSNTEIVNGGMGIYLLFIFLLPVGVILYRKKEYIVWTVLSLVMFGLSTFFSYNLRYYIVILVLLLMIICVTISLICNRFLKNRVIYTLFIGIIIIVNLIPNVSKMWEVRSPLVKLALKGESCDDKVVELLKQIPETSWVFCATGANRGDWKGVMYTDTWYNDYFLRRMKDDGMGYEQILQCFDYVLYVKNQDIPHIQLAELIDNAGNENSILERFLDNQAAVIFKVKDMKQKELYSFTGDAAMDISSSSVLFFRFDDTSPESYAVSGLITNPNENSVTVAYQIAWYDEKGEIIDIERNFLPLESGTHRIEETRIKGCNEAYYGEFLFYSYFPDEAFQLNSLEFYVDKDRSYINNMVEDYYNRTSLKRLE